MSTYKVICKNPSTAGQYSVCFPVHENVTVGRVLEEYNRAAQYKGVGNFTSVTCDGMAVHLKIRMRELVSIWKALHSGDEGMIVEIIAH